MFFLKGTTRIKVTQFMTSNVDAFIYYYSHLPFIWWITSMHAYIQYKPLRPKICELSLSVICLRISVNTIFINRFMFYLLTYWPNDKNYICFCLWDFMFATRTSRKSFPFIWLIYEETIQLPVVVSVSVLYHIHTSPLHRKCNILFYYYRVQNLPTT